MIDVTKLNLETRRLFMRAAAVNDAQAIFDAYASDPQATRYLVFEPLTDVRQAVEYLERTMRDREQGKSMTWVILLTGTQQIIGAIDFRINGAVGDIGFAIGRPWWGKAYVPEAAQAVLDFARAHIGIKRVTGRCDYENVRSARVFEKLGFQSLGVKDRAIVHPAFGTEPRPAILFERRL